MTSSHALRPYAHQRARQMLVLQGLSQIADHLAHSSPFLACFAEVVCDIFDSAPASSKYEVGVESWAARKPSRAQRGVVLPGSAYPGEGYATGLPEWGRTSAVTATKTSTAR